MDPEATLKSLRDLVRFVEATPEDDDLTESAEEFATLFEALDDWLRGGGFLPADWDR